MSVLPLFSRFPGLASALPYVALGSLPTPVVRWSALAGATGAASLWLKQDDISGPLYGGNKVRKLEFLLGAARVRGAGSVLTFGAAGSNHALATAIYAGALGLEAISMMVPQEPGPTVRRNLLRGLAAGASLRLHGGRGAVRGATVAEVAGRFASGAGRPFIIPAGGSAPLGTVGFVNAALELADQVAAGELPAPDRIYVASGTMGTCVGLLLGLAVAGLPTEVVAVRVTVAPYTSPEKARRLFARTAALLRRADPAFPQVAFPEARFTLRDDFLGPGYGRATAAGTEAVARAASAGVTLEGTYTGKALACLLAVEAARAGNGRNILFWNTYNSVPQGEAIKAMDYHQLPADFHRYFTESDGGLPG